MKRYFLKILLFVIWGMVFFTNNLDSAIITVATTEDNVPGSLRAAITIANQNNESDTIYLPKGTYFLSGETNDDNNVSGDLDINTTDKLTIIGDGSGITIIDGNRMDRIFHILNGTVSINNVTIRNGYFNCVLFERGDGTKYIEQEHGGGIYNNGTLTLNNSTISKNSSKNGCFICFDGGCAICSGSHGGGIYNTGTLELRNCTVSENHSGGRVYGWLSHTGAGSGGGIYNSGTLYMADCVVKANITGYTGGNGGGIFNYETGSMTLERCTIRDNKANDGGWERHMEMGTGGGNGGGIYNYGEAKVSYCNITNNITGEGGWGDNLFGFAGNGGGIFNHGNFIIENSAIIANVTGDWNAGAGGGIFSSGEMTITNSTISENATGNGIDEVGEYFTGSGGGIFISSGKITLISCTVCNNRTGQENVQNRSGHGGGIYVDNEGACFLANTITANNQVFPDRMGPDCLGILNSQGYNLIGNANDCTVQGDLTGNIIGTAPRLGPLAFNGGLTKTHALLSGSPAVDSGSGFGLSVDQRGYIRPIDNPDVINASDGTDIGSYESNAVSLPQIQLNPMRLNFGMDTSITSPNSQTFFVDNKGEGTLEWTLNPDVAWLNCTPESGIGPGLVTVQVDIQGLLPGTYLGNIHVEAPGAINSPQKVTVILKIYASGSSSSPFGIFSTPLDGTTVSGSIPVTGWVLDDIGVQCVQIFRGEGNAMVFIGDAVFVRGARPDIEIAYPSYPYNDRAGWGYLLLTNFLPNRGNGTFEIHAIATDIEGNQVSLGSKTIICDNDKAVKPFGAIDTPDQGGIASGSRFVNFGWSLTPLPKRIPVDGSTITIWIDGVVRGHPVYNRYRQDIASLFPDYNNSNGAGGHFYLDTTQYENGVHTISWSVTDNAGNTDGIGSRYFTIQNSSDSSSYKTEKQGAALNSFRGRIPGIMQIPVDFFNFVKVKRGYNQNIEPKIIYPDDKGDIVLEVKEMQPVEIHMESVENECLGFLLIGQQLRAFPIGATFDQKRNIFSWVPGPGFIGEYTFVFINIPKTGELKRKLITFRIRPQFE